jgi:Fic-DOC domain mobile mystery protein B
MTPDPGGATPLDADEAAALIPDHLVTQVDLNEWEAENIAKAMRWLERRRSMRSILTIPFVLELHRQMLGDTWRWAGTLRISEKNIGVAPHTISQGLSDLLGDTAHWIKHEVFGTDEIAARFHHRLVQIHLFPNGNGRHSRLMADVLLVALKAKGFSWGSGNLDREGLVRSRYIESLRMADRGDYSALLLFVRS